MDKLYNVSSSPHARNRLTTGKAMYQVILSLMPATVFGIYRFGTGAFLVIAASVLSAVLTEYIFDRITGRPNTVKDGSAVVTGLLLALCLPAYEPLYVPCLGSIFAILFVKCFFGGIGHNFMNPALAGRCFLLISFSGVVADFSLDGMSSATPLEALASGQTVNVTDAFLGFGNGVIGSSILALCIGGIYLLAVRAITYEIPLATLVSFSVFLALFGGHGLDLEFIILHLVSGGIMMGALFMATDPVTSPVTSKGQFIFGGLIGILSGIFRVYGSAPDSASYAIIIANMAVPLIDEISVPVPFGLRKPREGKRGIPKSAVILCVITLIAGAALSSVYVMTEDQIAVQKAEAKAASYREVCPDAADFTLDEKINGTIEALEGEDYGTDFGKAYCDSLQTTQGAPDGWGKDSLCGMAKHWPGGGPCEGGRDAHYPFGKFAVYPGDNLSDHLKPFLEGVFKLDGPTGAASAIMPYYTVSWGVDQKDGKNVGNSYSRYIIHDLLREKYGYDGIVCTDWGITADPEPEVDSFSSRCYGVEELTEAQRHLLAIENGVDQFGGNSAIAPILEAYQIGCQRHGEAAMRARMEQSAVRLLKNIFRCGLFENPYLDPAESARVAGCEEFCRAGYEAQLKSVVMVKNQGALPQRDRKKVYIPTRHIGPMQSFFRSSLPAQDIDPAATELVEKYYDRVSTPQEADFALVFMESPLSDGYSKEDREAGGNGYVPISLQYRPYTAQAARPESIAGGDFREAFTNRGYQGKTGFAANEGDLDLLLDTKAAMGQKPVIAVLRMHKPTVPAEFEQSADGILIDFGVQAQAIFDLVSGRAEPSGLLPVQMPANMETVERHCEDVPFDMEPYTDAAGHCYDFGFGMDWSGPIQDERTKRYTK